MQRSQEFVPYEEELCDQLDQITRHRVITPEERARTLARSLDLVRYFEESSKRQIPADQQRGEIILS